MTTISSGEPPKRQIEIEPIEATGDLMVTVRVRNEMVTSVFAATVAVEIHHISGTQLIAVHARDHNDGLIAIGWTDEVMIDDNCGDGVKIADKHYDGTAATDC